MRQSLRIRIGRNKFNTGNTLVDHMLDSIAASTTYANHLDDGTQRCIVDHIKFHDFTPVRNAGFYLAILARCDNFQLKTAFNKTFNPDKSKIPHKPFFHPLQHSLARPLLLRDDTAP